MQALIGLDSSPIVGLALLAFVIVFILALDGRIRRSRPTLSLWLRGVGILVGGFVFLRALFTLIDAARPRSREPLMPEMWNEVTQPAVLVGAFLWLAVLLVLAGGSWPPHPVMVSVLKAAGALTVVYAITPMIAC